MTLIDLFLTKTLLFSDISFCIARIFVYEYIRKSYIRSYTLELPSFPVIIHGLLLKAILSILSPPYYIIHVCPDLYTQENEILYLSTLLQLVEMKATHFYKRLSVIV
jgi:hypothetical protein